MTRQMRVPLLDLKAQYDTIRAEIEPAIREVLESQWFILGPVVQAFEEAVAGYCGAKHAIGCGSGSDAVLLPLAALGIGPGDEVICPAYTFFATAGSIHRLGARPVFADIEPVTYAMDPDHVRVLARRCTRLKAIMPVHLFGQTVDLDAYTALGQELGVPIIEDAAQAIGARDATGTVVGARSAAACFSFFPSKNLGGYGDGGLITTDDDELAARIRRLRVHGMEPKYVHHEVGMNSRLDAIQAAVLQVKLRHLEAWHAGRRANADFYDRAFADAGATSSATPLAAGGLALRTPHRLPEPARHIYNQYVIRVPAEIRDPLREHLASSGVGTEIYYPISLHLQDCFADLGGKVGDLPASESAARETLALPIYAELTEEQQAHVANAVIEFVSQRTVVGV